jgi:predicted protein tyrosine phosphatase
MPLDFKRATDLFMGREEELARALGVDTTALRRHRARPEAVPAALVRSLADALAERGRAMIRVAEMLHEQAADAESQGNGSG